MSSRRVVVGLVAAAIGIATALVSIGNGVIRG
jgi:hypothetical protein